MERVVFPGDTFSHIHRFPTITAQGKNNQLKWTIYVGLLKAKTDNMLMEILNGKVGAEIIEGFSSYTEPIDGRYFDNCDMAGMVAFTVVDAHQVVKGNDGAKFKAMSFVVKGKNLKKANKTNCFTQAMTDALSKYKKKLGTEFIEPMLADGTAVSTDEVVNYLREVVTERVLVQRKLDGIRMLANEGSTYSRGGKPVSITEEMRRELDTIISRIEASTITPDGCKLYLDGELYKHGVSLSDISGRARSFEADPELEYWIYDLFFAKDNSIYPMRMSQRERILRNIEKRIPCATIKFVQTLAKTSNAEEIRDIYMQALDDSYEGLILRFDRPYNNINRKSMIKIKELITEEFRIVDFTQGIGKMEKTLIYVCETTPKSVSAAKAYLSSKGKDWASDKLKRFNVTPKGTLDERKALFKKLHHYDENGKKYFDLHVKNRLYTVEFNNWSKYLVPMCPVGVCIRDF